MPARMRPALASVSSSRGPHGVQRQRNAMPCPRFSSIEGNVATMALKIWLYAAPVEGYVRLNKGLVVDVLLESWLFENVFFVSTREAFNSMNACERLPSFMAARPMKFQSSTGCWITAARPVSHAQANAAFGVAHST